MSFIFFLGRAQKIATAVYLISGLLSEQEPIRTELRKVSLALLSDMRTFSDNPLANDALASRIRAVLEHILSLSELASRAGHISTMNNDFLRSEAESFMNDLATSLQAKEKETPIERSLKDVASASRLPILSSRARSLHKRHHKGHDKGHRSVSGQQKFQPVFGEFKEMKGPIKDILLSGTTNTDRKEKIYQIIQEKGSLTIKDIAGVAPEYSEKTIQRDLVEMVENGRVKKKGERRWTTYFI